MKKRQYWDPEWHEQDPFDKVGLIRIVAFKHNNVLINWFQKSTVTIVHSNIFQFGFTTRKDDQLAEDFGCSDDHIVHDLLKDLPNGPYEIVGELYHFGYTHGYESPEYDFEIQVRDEKIKAISYDDATTWPSEDNEVLSKHEIRLTELNPNVSGLVDWSCVISKYMNPLEIARSHAATLVNIIGRIEYRMAGTRSFTNVKSMNADELEMFIHMCMLEIDSNSEKNKDFQALNDLALMVDAKVKEILSLNQELMGG